MLRYAALLTFIAFALCSQGLAQASPDERAEGKKHFERGAQLFEDGALEPATVELRRAYELNPSLHGALYSLGMAYAAMGKPVDAVDAFQRYLDEGGPNADKRARALAELKVQKQRIAQLTIRVSEDGATVEIDGAEVGKSPLVAPVPVGVGEHRVTVSADGFRAVTRTESVVGEERRTLELSLERVEAPEPAPVSPLPAQSPSASEAPAPPPPAGTPNPESAAASPWPWVVVGVSGALMVGGGVLVLMARSDINKVEGASKGTRWPVLESAYDSAPAMSAAGFAMLGVGAAGVATGLLWKLIWSGGHGGTGEEPPMEAALSTDRIVVRGRF